jgi:hypothetical protein
MQYGSFVPTPPNEFNPEQLELPAPAVRTSQEIADAPHRGTLHMPKRGRYRDVDGAAPESAPNSNAYRVGETNSPPPHRTAIGSIFHKGSNLVRHASTANVPQPREPVPLLRRIISHTGTMPLEDPNADVNMVPIEHVRARELEFFDWMDNQLRKVETFYKEKEDQAGERLLLLREQLHEMRNRRIEEIARHRLAKNPGLDPAKTLNDGASKSSSIDEREREGGLGFGNRIVKPVEKAYDAARHLRFAPRPGANSKALQKMGPVGLGLPDTKSPEAMQRAHGHDPASDYVRKHPEGEVSYRSAKRKLKLALKEYYRGLELLKSYALLNRTAFRKINKKYDKAANAHPPLGYMTEKVNKAWFVRSEVLDNYLHSVEDLYARYFEKGNHKVAIGKLRSSTTRPGEFTLSAFRSGLMLGTGAVFGIQGLINAVNDMHYHESPAMRIQTSYLMQIYGGYFLALFLFAFFCVDAAIWTRNKINYVFIFEFDPRNHLDWRQMSEFPAFLTLLLGLFVWVNFSRYGAEEMYLYYPVVLIGLTLILIFMPVPVLFPRSRSWFVYSHWRLLLAGLYPVEFRDFFLGDIYCSLTYVTAVSPHHHVMALRPVRVCC